MIDTDAHILVNKAGKVVKRDRDEIDTGEIRERKEGKQSEYPVCLLEILKEFFKID